MAAHHDDNDFPAGGDGYRASSSVEELLIAALNRGGDIFQTGRYLVTLKGGAGAAGFRSLKTTQGMRIADARDFDGQAATLENIGDADALVLPEIGIALVSGDTARERNMLVHQEVAASSAIASIDHEYFVFADAGSSQYLHATDLAHTMANTASNYLSGFAGSIQETSGEYLHGFLRAADIIARDLQHGNGHQQLKLEEEVLVLGVTWGLIACGVPHSVRQGAGIKLAILGTGLDLGHPDFSHRQITSATFSGQPVHDLMGHATHCTGTACGPKAPAGSILRYGIGSQSAIFAGKVLTDSGTGTQAGVLAGINWAIANRCPVILNTFGSSMPVQPAYTAAGEAALNNGCLIIAPAGGSAAAVGAPANSPTIMSVAAVSQSLQPSSFSSFGKIDIAAPGVDIFSSWPRPRRYNSISGTSSAAAHVAGCAVLWAEKASDLRGGLLWRKLQASAKLLPFPAIRVGAGLVQAP